MADTNKKSWVVVASEQAWFKACAKAEQFDPFPANSISAWRGSTKSLSHKILIGRGPLKKNVFTLPTFFLSYEPETSPPFAIPNQTSDLAASIMMKQPSQEWVELQGDEVGLLIEAYAVKHFTFDALAQYKSEVRTSGLSQQAGEKSIKNLIRELFSDVERRVDILIGLHAIRHFALVWKPLHRAQQLIQIDAQTKEAQIHEEASLAALIPYQFNAEAREALWVSYLPIEKISGAKVHIPLVLFQNALWEKQSRIRFLHEFWVLEYFADLYSTEDKEKAVYINELERLVKEHLANRLELFGKLKGDILRSSLMSNLKSCFQALGITFNEGIVRQAKRVRDKLSHGQDVEDAEIVAAEAGIRYLPPLLIRKHLQANGISLDG